MIEYRDRNIGGALIQKLCKEFDEKFTEEEKELNIYLKHVINVRDHLGQE